MSQQRGSNGSRIYRFLLWARAFPFLAEVRSAWRNVVRQRRRSAVAITAVASGVIALILASGFNEFMFWAFRESTIRSQIGHIQIARPGFHQSGQADPAAYALPEEIPNFGARGSAFVVKAIAPRLNLSGLISHGETTISFLGNGIDPVAESAFGDEPRLVAGKRLDLDGTGGVMLGEGLARNLGAGVGDKVVLLSTSAAGSTTAVEVSVVGLFSSVSKAYDDIALRLPIRTARRLTGIAGSHVWVVLLDRTEQTDVALAAFRSMLPTNEFEILPWYALADYYNKSKALFDKQLYGIWLIVAVIIVLAIGNTMMMNVMERTGEVGMAMALGVRRASIMRGFLLEGFLIGLLGGLGGLLGGISAAEIISAIGIPMPPPPGKAHGYIAGIMVTTPISCQAVSLAAVTALSASLYPAWIASRRPIVDALRHNR
jgi:putative ABC transport system permease protein